MIFLGRSITILRERGGGCFWNLYKILTKPCTYNIATHNIPRTQEITLRGTWKIHYIYYTQKIDYIGILVDFLYITLYNKSNE